MTIEKQYYMSCNACGRLYESKADDALGLEDEAVDDGWLITDEKGYDGHGECRNLHHCPECVNSEKNNHDTR